MSPDLAVDLVREAAYLGLLVAAPALIVSLVAGLAISLLQAVTQMQEQTLSFAPRMLLVAATALLLMPWTLDRLAEYASTLYRGIPANF